MSASRRRVARGVVVRVAALGAALVAAGGCGIAPSAFTEDGTYRDLAVGKTSQGRDGSPGGNAGPTPMGMAVPGVLLGVLVAAVVISRAPGRPVFWVVGLVGLGVCAAIGVALALGWRPKRARPPMGIPSVWDRER